MEWLINFFGGVFNGISDILTTIVKFVTEAITKAIGFGWFTGQHSCMPEDRSLLDTAQARHIGKVVVCTGNMMTIPHATRKDPTNMRRTLRAKQKHLALREGPVDGVTVDDAWPVVRLSSAYMQRSVFGVISSVADDHRNRMLRINSQGEGAVRVDGSRGNVAVGDLLVTSSNPGYACRQDDDLVRSSTLAKANMAVDFQNDDFVRTDEDGVAYALVGVTYKV